MKPTFKRKLLATSLMTAISGIAITAEAQEVKSVDEIVVTGTLIRGTEVTGSQTIGVDAETIGEIGATNTNEVLASVPQISNFFNSRPEVEPRAAANLVVSRPNLRNIPLVNSSTGSVTLILMDGHRIAPVGVQAAIVDADIVLGSTLQSVDIVTDGGSSLYGADAVAGVINFITKDQFEGVKIDLDYGSDDDGEFSTQNFNVTAGTSWDSGSIYLSATHSERDGLRNEDRDWAQIGTYDDTGELIPAGSSDFTECPMPVRTEYNWFNYGPTSWTDNPLAPDVGLRSLGDPTCDAFAKQTLLPEQEREGLFLSYQQELNDSVQLGVKTYYSERMNTFFSFPLGDTAPAPFPVTTNPNNLTQQDIDQFGLDPVIPGQDYAYPAGAGFNYSVHPAYQQRDQVSEMNTWGIAPTLTIDAPGDWQVRNTLYYGRSYNENLLPQSNSQAMADAVTGGQLDPTDVASADASVINNILNWETKKQTIHELFLARVVADGPLMELPAGTLRMAGGFEVNQDRVRTRAGTGTIGSLSSTDFSTASRDNTSVFAELHIPVLESLELSASLRHDDYSDFGKTTNPQVGFTFEPTEGLRFYGHWGESFNAPTTLDSLASFTGRISDPQGTQSILDADVFNEWNGASDLTIILEGNLPGLEPQTAETWAVGFDIEPLEGLTIKANYYDIRLKGLIGGLAVPTNQIRMDFPDKFIWNISPAEWEGILDTVSNPEAFDSIDPNSPATEFAYIFDRRVDNFANAEMKGVDFGVSYFHDTDFGSFDYGLSGNHQTDLILDQGGVVTDAIEFAPDLTLQGTLGWRGENLRAKVTVNYTDSFDAQDANNQSTVDEFIVTNLFVGYDFSGSGFTEGLSLRFNVDNVFDEDPPEFRSNNSNETKFSGFTIGRVYKLGISKTFF